MKPYTYLIKFKPTGQCYYGSRFKNVRLGLNPEDDLMINYTTSSNKINNLISEHGLDAFEWEVRRTFDTPKQAAEWEIRVLKRCKVLESEKWFNSNVAGHILLTEEGRKKISDYHSGKPKSKEHKEKISKTQQGSKRPWSKNNLPKDVAGSNNPMYGKQHSDETKRKISEANKAKGHMIGDNNPMRKIEWTEELRKSMGDRSRGTKWTKEAIEARSAKLRGQKREKIHCPHCDRHIARGWYHRHGDHCSTRV